MEWMHHLWVFVTVFVILSEGLSENCGEEIEDPFKFLECNEKHLNLVEEDEIVLVLGNCIFCIAVFSSLFFQLI